MTTDIIINDNYRNVYLNKFPNSEYLLLQSSRIRWTLLIWNKMNVISVIKSIILLILLLYPCAPVCQRVWYRDFVIVIPSAAVYPVAGQSRRIHHSITKKSDTLRSRRLAKKSLANQRANGQLEQSHTHHASDAVTFCVILQHSQPLRGQPTHTQRSQEVFSHSFITQSAGVHVDKSQVIERGEERIHNVRLGDVGDAPALWHWQLQVRHCPHWAQPVNAPVFMSVTLPLYRSHRKTYRKLFQFR